MKRIYLIIFTFAFLSCDNEDVTPTNEFMISEFNPVQVNGNTISIDFDLEIFPLYKESTSNSNFNVRLFSPSNVDFDNNVSNIQVNGATLSGEQSLGTRRMSVQFDINPDQYNYLTLEVNNGDVNKYINFQVLEEGGDIPFLAVHRTSSGDIRTPNINYDMSVFRIDLYSKRNYRILSTNGKELWTITAKNPNQLVSDSGTGATTIIELRVEEQ
ncbi:hypothetical protein [Arenibacter sp. F20364]|uniref:hypothetical protein n=1 Tax=Arenibacter sp. F20364 TaxID=2926415 RepID=UPI001FF264C1|nr:hypothetical protein [Arenibacter sp. F20364]MCK0192676.1 hypothetical protein [Arenibacter sp. F20364]